MPVSLIKEKIEINSFKISLPSIWEETLNQTTNEMEKLWNSFYASIYILPIDEKKKIIKRILW